jgi:hypothetical protein
MAVGRYLNPWAILAVGVFGGLLRDSLLCHFWPIWPVLWAVDPDLTLDPKLADDPLPFERFCRRGMNSVVAVALCKPFASILMGLGVQMGEFWLV